MDLEKRLKVEMCNQTINFMTAYPRLLAFYRNERTTGSAEHNGNWKRLKLLVRPREKKLIVEKLSMEKFFGLALIFFLVKSFHSFLFLFHFCSFKWTIRKKKLFCPKKIILERKKTVFETCVK